MIKEPWLLLHHRFNQFTEALFGVQGIVKRREDKENLEEPAYEEAEAFEELNHEDLEKEVFYNTSAWSTLRFGTVNSILSIDGLLIKSHCCFVFGYLFTYQ